MINAKLKPWPAGPRQNISDGIIIITYYYYG